MNIETIAATTVALLAPYLTEAGKAVAKEVGKAAWQQVEGLFQVVRDRFQGNPAAETALKDLEKAPDDPDSQAALRKELKKALHDDDAFAARLMELIRKDQLAEATYSATAVGSGAAAAGVGNVIAGERGVAVGGKVKGPVTTGDVKPTR